LRTPLAVPAALAAVAALAVVVPASARPQKSVTVGDDYFVRAGAPPTITVRKGTRVTWRWAGKSLHNVHARIGPATFKSDYKKRGTFSKVLTRPGKYVVYCDIHQPDMKLTIRVRK
jgi:plastocyanin